MGSSAKPGIGPLLLPWDLFSFLGSIFTFALMIWAGEGPI